MDTLIDNAAARVKRFLRDSHERAVWPQATALLNLKKLSVPLQEQSLPPGDVLAELDAIGSPATVASVGGRYFGFVTGGALPAALAANMLAAAWDQNAHMEVGSPVAAQLEKVCRGWLTSVLDLPLESEVGFVTGATMANLTGLAAARHALLAAHGWDVERQGLFGAPAICVIVGDEVHVSVLKALALLGLGCDRVIRVPVDNQGRMIPADMPPIAGPTIVCAQSGNVNTGAFDPIEAIAARLAGTGAWLHVDGAFGLWARASVRYKHLAAGLEQADSIATDAHKWLNVPYDCGLVFVREHKHLNAAMAASAPYLIDSETRDPHRCTPEISRRARGVEVWAALRSLGTSGLADLIERCCSHAQRFANAMRDAGFDVLNEVVLNQVLVSFGTADVTRRVIAAVQQDGTCWCGGTQWQGQTAMRISVSSWATTAADVDRSIEAVLRVAKLQMMVV